MTSFVLTYQGSPELQSLAEARLRAQYPRLKLSRKTPLVFEAQTEGRVPSAGSLLGAWKVSPMTYAEIDEPGVSLKGLRKRLAELRGS